MADTDTPIEQIRVAHATLFMHYNECTMAQRILQHDTVNEGLRLLEAAIAEKDSEIRKGNEAYHNAWSHVHARDRTIARLNREIARLRCQSEHPKEAMDVPGWIESKRDA